MQSNSAALQNGEMPVKQAATSPATVGQIPASVKQESREPSRNDVEPPIVYQGEALCQQVSSFDDVQFYEQGALENVDFSAWQDDA